MSEKDLGKSRDEAFTDFLATGGSFEELMAAEEAELDRVLGTINGGNVTDAAGAAPAPPPAQPPEQEPRRQA